MENGKQRNQMGDVDFMTRDQVYECIKQLKTKNCEGYHRIPQRIILDGIDSLIDPFQRLFSLIYKTKVIQGQWLILKITPIHKKGSKQEI